VDDVLARAVVVPVLEVCPVEFVEVVTLTEAETERESVPVPPVTTGPGA
jgi:hypothetical protein